MKQVRPIKEIKLSQSEKDDVYSHILKKAGIENLPVKSPYVFKGFFKVEQLRFVYATLVVFLVSGSTALASLNALPGDILYPVKTKIIEKVPDAFAWSNEAKAKRNTKKFEERVTEFEVLAEQGKLSEKTATDIDMEVRKELDAFARNVQKIEDKKEKRIELDVVLQNKIEKHEEKLEKIKQDNRSDNKVLNNFLDQNKDRLKRINEKDEKEKLDDQSDQKNDEKEDLFEDKSETIEEKFQKEIESAF